MASSSNIEQNLSTAVAYYTAMGKQDFESLEKYIHSDIQFTGPVVSVKGKEAFLQAAQGFASIIKNLTIREKFASGDQAMIVYNCEFSQPQFQSAGPLRAAALISFQNGLIAKLELFFDASPFHKNLSSA